MKKLISFILCMVLAFASFGNTVFAAEDEELEQYTWAEVKAELDEMEVEGSFERLPGTGLKMWIPDYLERLELDSYDIEDGEIAFWSDEEGVRQIEVFYSETDAESIEEYAEELTEYYGTEPAMYLINGRKTLVFTDEETDSGVVVVADEGGKLVDIWLTPLEDSEFSVVAECAAISLMPSARDSILPNTTDDEEDLFAITWEEAEKQKDELKLEGRYVTFDEVAVKMWIPEEYQNALIDPADYEEGLIAGFMTEDESSGFRVEYVDAEGKDLEALTGELEKDKRYSDIDKTVVNGNTGVIYNDDEEDLSTIVFETKKGCFFKVTMMPVSDEEFQKTAILVFASITAEKESVLDVIPKGVDFFAVTWQEARDYIEENEVKGGYVQIGDLDLSVWVPDTLKAREEEKNWPDDGIIAMFDSENGNTVTVTYKDAEGADLFGKYEEEISKNDGAEYFDALLVNGLAALSYSVADQTGYIAFETEKGCILTFAFEDFNDEDFLVDAQIMIYSMLPGDYVSETSEAHNITVTKGADLFEDCPKTAKAGEIVTVKTVVVADGELIVNVSGTDTGEFTGEGVYEFIMPDEDVEISASVSTAGYPGS